MINVKNKLDRLGKLQSSISMKFDQLENNMINETKFFLNNEEHQLNFYCNLEYIMKDNCTEKYDFEKNNLKYENILNSKEGQKLGKLGLTKKKSDISNSKMIPAGYLANTIKITEASEDFKINTFKINESSNKCFSIKENNKKNSDQETPTIKEISMITQKNINNPSYDHPFSTFRNSEQHNQEKIINSNNNLLEKEFKYYKLHKKQNDFLTNELVNLRVKLNKIKNKNQILKRIMKNEEGVKNCNLIGKLIISYIEKLAVNWDEIVEMLIDELIEEEILILNEIELEKTNKLTSSYIIKILPSHTIQKKSVYSENLQTKISSVSNKASLLEINKILSEYKNQEEEIYIRYLK